MATETAVFAVRSAKPCFAGLLVQFVTMCNRFSSGWIESHTVSCIKLWTEWQILACYSLSLTLCQVLFSFALTNPGQLQFCSDVGNFIWIISVSYCIITIVLLVAFDNSFSYFAYFYCLVGNKICILKEWMEDRISLLSLIWYHMMWNIQHALINLKLIESQLNLARGTKNRKIRKRNYG